MSVYLYARLLPALYNILSYKEFYLRKRAEALTASSAANISTLERDLSSPANLWLCVTMFMFPGSLPVSSEIKDGALWETRVDAVFPSEILSTAASVHSFTNYLLMSHHLELISHLDFHSV